MTSGQVASIVCSPFCGGEGADLGRDAVGREDQRGVVGDLVHLFDEAGALVAQLVDDVAVVDDLLADVDGAVGDLEGLLDDVDGAHDAGAEPAQARDRGASRRGSR